MANNVCAKCGDAVSGQALKIGEEVFHAACFTCDKCKEQIKGPFSRTPDGGRQCQSCSSKTCEACQKPITGRTMQVEGGFFHPECFTCAGCKNSLQGSYFKLEGKYTCQSCKDAKVPKGSAGGTTETPCTGERNCKGCGDTIKEDSIRGAAGEYFHADCFKCQECTCKLTSFFLDKERRYLCGPCANKENEVDQGPTARPCVVCGDPCEPGSKSLWLIDNSCVHWSCFKCDECGKAEAPAADGTCRLTNLRSRLEALKRKSYVCDACKQAHAPPPDPSVVLRHVENEALFGTYIGKARRDGADIVYSIRLAEGNLCWLDFTSKTKISVTSWHVAGKYVEKREGQRAIVHVTINERPFNAGPERGEELEINIVKSETETNESLMYDGVQCACQLGVPDVEVHEMMRHAPDAPKLAPVPQPKDAATAARDVVAGPKHVQGSASVMERTHVDTQTFGIVKQEDVEAAPMTKLPSDTPEGCYSLEDLRDPTVWKELGIDTTRRETYLSDSAFEAVFGMSKADFEKQPKWKRDQLKKAHRLF